MYLDRNMEFAQKLGFNTFMYYHENENLVFVVLYTHNYSNNKKEPYYV